MCTDIDIESKCLMVRYSALFMVYKNIIKLGMHQSDLFSTTVIKRRATRIRVKCWALTLDIKTLCVLEHCHVSSWNASFSYTGPFWCHYTTCKCLAPCFVSIWCLLQCNKCANKLGLSHLALAPKTKTSLYIFTNTVFQS